MNDRDGDVESIHRGLARNRLNLQEILGQSAASPLTARTGMLPIANNLRRAASASPLLASVMTACETYSWKRFRRSHQSRVSFWLAARTISRDARAVR